MEKNDFEKMMEEMQKQALELQQQAMEYAENVDFSAFSDLISEGLMDGMLEDDGEEEEKKQEFIQQHLPPEELSKYLVFGSFLVQFYSEPVQTLPLMDDVDSYLGMLENHWGITDRESGLAKVDWLLNQGHHEAFNDIFVALKENNNLELIDDEDVESYQDTVESLLELGFTEAEIKNCPSILGWDIDRAGFLTRVFAKVGFITEEEAWNLLKEISVKAKGKFSSWREFGISLVMGRAVSMGYNIYYFNVLDDLLNESPEFLNQYPIENSNLW